MRGHFMLLFVHLSFEAHFEFRLAQHLRAWATAPYPSQALPTAAIAIVQVHSKQSGAGWRSFTGDGIQLG